MYPTNTGTPTALTAPAALALWWATATVLTAWCLQGFPAGFTVAMTAASALGAGVLAVLIVRRPSLTNQIRVLAYLCAVVATQGVGVFTAVAALTPGIPYASQDFGPWVLVEVLGGPALSLWTYFIVRAWAPGVRVRSARSGLLSSGCAAATASLLVLFTANVAYHTLIGVLAVPDVDYPMHASGTDQWLALALALGLAGVAEEPVFAGIAVVLWPSMPGRTFVAVWALSAVARAGIHLYYAAGAGAATGVAVLLVVLWCAMWSGFNLFLVYRTRRLWPVMLAHGLQNTIGLAIALSISYVSLADEVLLSAVFAAILGTLVFIAGGSLWFLARSVRLLWSRGADDQVKGRNCPLVQTPQWPPEPQSHHTIG